jgi:2,3-bisphosphoglycerate-dependent phosphoglycerate mutase
VRHGAYEQPPGVPSALLPHPLTDEGREQARAAVTELVDLVTSQGWSLDPTIHTSRQLRAWETGSLIAEGLTERLGVPFCVQEHEALSERSLGSAANLTVEEIARILERDPRVTTPLPERWKSRADFRLPLQGAESLRQAGERVADHLRAHVKEPGADESDTLQVFVGHGASFRFAAVALGLFSAADAEARSVYHCRPIVLERLGADAWAHAAGEWKPRSRRPAPASHGGD